MKIEPIFSIVPVPALQQIKIGSRRYYSTGNITGASVTTILKNRLPTSPYLIEYFKTNGKNSDEISRQAADYGTFYHIVCGYIAEHGKITLSTVYDLLTWHSEQKGWVKTSDWADKAYKQAFCFAQFLIDKEVTIQGIEVPVIGKIAGHPVGGSIDIIAELNFNRKRVTAIIDIKSRDSGQFYESERYQLECYKILAEQNGINTDMMFNFSPKNYQEKPTYSLENQTDKTRKGSLENLILDYYYQKENKIPDKYLFIPDEINMQDYKQPEYIEFEKFVMNEES